MGMSNAIDGAKVQDAYHYALAAAGDDMSVFTGRDAYMSRSKFLRAALRDARVAGLELTTLAPSYLKPRLENAANIAKAIRYAAAKHGIEAYTGEPHAVTWT
jgi:hypothetical protein